MHRSFTKAFTTRVFDGVSASVEPSEDEMKSPSSTGYVSPDACTSRRFDFAREERQNQKNGDRDFFNAGSTPDFSSLPNMSL
jgi:hypothetical protein